MNANRQSIFVELNAERERQDAKWGEQNWEDGTGHTHYRRQAEACKRICEIKFQQKTGTWLDILNEEFYEAMAESNVNELRAELIQVAAVCINWIEAIDRRMKK